MLRSALVLLGVLAVWSSLVVAEPTLEGPFIQGGMVVGQAPGGSRIKHDGREVRVSPEGVFVIGFGRDAPAESVLEWTDPEGQSQRRVLTVQQRQYQIQRIDGLPPRKVTPKPEDLERIRADIAAARKARDRDDPRTDFLTGFIWPSVGPISGVYGSQRILNGEPRRPHFGVDVAAPVGAPVVAPADGLVTLVHDDMFYSGGTLIIDHGHGLSSSFLHLNRILVKEGQRVKQGDLVAEVGATGRVTGAHLDWRMNLADRRIDPQLLVGPMPTETAN